MTIEGVIKNFNDFSFEPFAKARQLREETTAENGTWTQAFVARGLFLVQVISSVAAVAFCLLAIFLAPVFALCSGENSCEALGVALGMAVLQLSFIPTSLISAVLPHSLKWDAPTKQLIECVS